MSRMAYDQMESNGNLYLYDDSTEWIPTGYPGYYVCREGFVMHNGYILKPHRGDIQGHLNVRIPIGGGKVKEVYIHRLVKEAFEGNSRGLPIVRHLDDDPSNNHLSNLEWGTQKDNHADSVRNGTYRCFTDTDREKHLVEQRTPVKAVRISDNEEFFFASQSEASKKLGVQQANIWKVLHGERKYAGGYRFEFVERGARE